jgi:hypothetical protein
MALLVAARLERRQIIPHCVMGLIAICARLLKHPIDQVVGERKAFLRSQNRETYLWFV